MSYKPKVLAVIDGGTGASTFTAGLVVANGTNTFTTQANNATGNLVFINSVTVTSGASVTQVSLTLTTTYNTYQLIMTGVIPATNAALLRMLFTDGSGQISSGYGGGFNANLYNSTTLSNTNSGTFFPLSTATSSTATYGYSGTAYLYNMSLIAPGSQQQYITGQAMYLNSTPAYEYGTIFGEVSPNAVITSIQLLYSSGNISQGIFTLFGILE
jgi:hypothetical protein